MPFQLGYVSTAVEQMLREDLLAILEVSRRTNRDNGVTGLLLFDGKDFLQVLEGDEASVRETYGRIAQDERHRDLNVLFEEQVDSAQFGQWSMGFQAVDGVDWLEFPTSDERPIALREMIERYGQAKDLLRKMHLHGLDPQLELPT
jgi:hypothetical protein